MSSRLKLAVVGNSHIMARKTALRDGCIFLPDCDVTFWGVPQGQFRSVTFDNNLLKSRFPDNALFVSENRFSELPVPEFDAILFEGTYMHLSRWCREHCLNPFSFASYTKGYLYKALLDRLEENTVFMRARDVAAATKVRVLLSLAPMEALRREETHQPVSSGPYDTLHDNVEAICQAYEIEYLRQPIATLTSSLHTDRRYLDGARRLILNTPVPETDLVHMNSDFGCHLWKTTAQALGLDINYPTNKGTEDE